MRNPQVVPGGIHRLKNWGNPQVTIHWLIAMIEKIGSANDYMSLGRLGDLNTHM